MPEPSQPEVQFGRFEPGLRDAMPLFGGRAQPGETIYLETDDGTRASTRADENGLWTLASPELDDGERSFELWAENANGERSEGLEWDSELFAGEFDRAEQRRRNEEWALEGQQRWRAANSGLTSTPVSAGSGGTGAGGSQGGDAAGEAGGGADQGTGEHPPTPIEKAEKGNTPAS